MKPSPFSPVSISTAIVPGSTWSVKVIFSVPRKPSPSNQRRLPVLLRIMSVIFPHRCCVFSVVGLIDSSPASGTLQHPHHPTGTPRAPVASYDAHILSLVLDRLRLPCNAAAAPNWPALGRCTGTQRSRNVRHGLPGGIPQQGKSLLPYQRDTISPCSHHRSSSLVCLHQR